MKLVLCDILLRLFCYLCLMNTAYMLLNPLPPMPNLVGIGLVVGLPGIKRTDRQTVRLFYALCANNAYKCEYISTSAVDTVSS
jgi:hypothetical protein